MSEVTRILNSIEQGDAQAAEALLPLVYEQLRRLAASQLAKEAPGQTLQATALVHEAWLRLAGSEERKWAGSRHFFNAAAEAMRRILVDNARRKASQKRGGDWERVDIEEVDVATRCNDTTILVINEAISKLTTVDPRIAELVKLRFFAGLPNDQAAEILGMSERTAKRGWAYARAWLAAELTN